MKNLSECIIAYLAFPIILLLLIMGYTVEIHVYKNDEELEEDINNIGN